MSENPYAGYPSERNRDSFGLDEPARVSILAVLSLICGVICCIPGLGILAFLFGALGLAGIGKSEGRVTGKPLAGVGMALGVIATVLWIALSIGIAQGYKWYTVQVVGGTSQMMEAVSDADIAGIRTHLLDPASADITDEDIAAFVAVVRRDFGDFVDAPTKWKEMGKGFADAYGGGGMRGGGGNNQEPAVPVALNFTNGSTVVHIVIEKDSFDTSKLRVEDIFIILKSGKALTLRKDGPGVTAALGMGFDPVHFTEIPAPGDAPAAPETPDPEGAPAPAPDEEAEPM